MANRALGWRPDVPDLRDHFRSFKPLKAIPKAADLRDGCPPIYDQKTLGSCTAQSVAGALQFTIKEEFGGIKVQIPSRLFIYYNTRVIQGTVKEDSGASLRDTMKAVARQGHCPEPAWPHNIAKFKVKPSAAAYRAAEPHKLRGIDYARVQQTLPELKAALAARNPIVFGFAVYEDSINAAGKTGVMPMPKKGERMDGGHAVVLVGYDDAKKAFLVRNSWGTSWGLKGYYWMPYAYVLDQGLSSDFWTVKSVPTEG